MENNYEIDVEVLYDYALTKMKEEFSKELIDCPGLFSINCGELWYSGFSGNPPMSELQKFIDSHLGQVEYMAVYESYSTVRARTEDEAREFLKLTNKGTPKQVFKTNLT